MTHRPRKPNPVVDGLAQLDGLQIDGGCDQCAAYQKLTTVAGGVFVLAVFHDDWCPFYIATRKGPRHDQS